jgi:hypothetical protein
VEAFCLTPVIACLFFVAGVVYVGDAYILYMRPVFTENFNDFTIFIFVLSLITCVGDHGLKHRYKTHNISTSSCVRATDPLW